ncbi:G-protein coupled receptor moody-like [Strongylocentrotus purpuratus]|uniref:G-protein coupled receptors family 1 profile domain-containing protein n=1 Tax=Strongylocentrotus purpuratus TaxID=7668 RepID=A0A7M7HQA2_STRPU|nr:G-protein coupled receptor moody-like [Strongylocentrotus purpuratus]
MDTQTVNLEGTTSMEPPEGTSFVYDTRSQLVVIVGSLLIIIGILGSFGNLMVILAVSLCRNLQNKTHVFVVSLSVADFITALTLPFQGFSVLSETGWPFGNGLCKLFGALLIFTLAVSFFTLAAIAVDRYIHITKSMRLQQKIYTRSSIAIMVAFLWLFPFLGMVVPQLIPATGGIKYSPDTRTCGWDFGHPMHGVFRNITSACAMFCTALIIFCYVAIMLYVRRHIRETRDILRVSSGNINNLVASPTGSSKMQIDITKNMAVVIVAFFLCLLPYSCSTYLYKPEICASLFFFVLLTLSTCLNPMIYAVKHPTFKKVFKCMVYFRFHDIPRPSAWLKNILRERNVASSRA